MTGSFAEVAWRLGAKTIVELGCGDGNNASATMSILPPDGRLFTINWPNPPSGDDPMVYLSKWIDDPRLHLIFGDTRDLEVASRIPFNINLLIIDSTHTCECATEEWRLYEPKLANRASVIVDDLDHGDMMDFWASIGIKQKFISDDCGRKVGFIAYSRK